MILSDAVITVKLGLMIMANELGEGDLELFQNTTSTMTLNNNQQMYQHLKAKNRVCLLQQPALWPFHEYCRTSLQRHSFMLHRVYGDRHSVLANNASL